jgi:hypothetical protein
MAAGVVWAAAAVAEGCAAVDGCAAAVALDGGEIGEAGEEGLADAVGAVGCVRVVAVALGAGPVVRGVAPVPPLLPRTTNMVIARARSMGSAPSLIRYRVRCRAARARTSASSASRRAIREETAAGSHAPPSRVPAAASMIC